MAAAASTCAAVAGYCSSPSAARGLRPARASSRELWLSGAAARAPARRAAGPVQAAAAADQQQQQQWAPGTVATRRLTSQEAIEALYRSQHARQRAHYAAFYSSELQGIVTDSALMLVAIDDHMVHRGHGVFDTATLVDGHLYQLDQHLARFLTSAAKASIPLPRRLGVEQLRRTILETAAAGRQLNGHVRYWLSAGRGGFGLSGSECVSPAFYCVVYTDEPVPDERLADYLAGWRVKTSPVPIKPSFFSGIKSNNYLPNVLNLMDAEADGVDQGIFVDGEGFVAEGPNMNMACLLDDGTLVVPPFDNALNGITVQRMMQLLPDAIAEGMEGIRRLEQRPIRVEEAKAAREVFLVGSSLPVMPVVQWDAVRIGDGTAGIVALQIRTMMRQDMEPRPGSDQHVAVPYGVLTGMEL